MPGVLKVYALGESDPVKPIAHYEIVMAYGNATKYLAKTYQHSCAERCFLRGFIDAIELITKPCHVQLLSAMPFETIKDKHLDLYTKLQAAIEKQQCTFESISLLGQSLELKRYIDDHRRTTVTSQ